jgi:hypothetical protein
MTQPLKPFKIRGRTGNARGTQPQDVWSGAVAASIVIPALEQGDPDAIYVIYKSMLFRNPARPSIGLEVLRLFRLACPFIRRALNLGRQFQNFGCDTRLGLNPPLKVFKEGWAYA